AALHPAFFAEKRILGTTAPLCKPLIESKSFQQGIRFDSPVAISSTSAALVALPRAFRIAGQHLTAALRTFRSLVRQCDLAQRLSRLLAEAFIHVGGFFHLAFWLLTLRGFGLLSPQL